MKYVLMILLVVLRVLGSTSILRGGDTSPIAEQKVDNLHRNLFWCWAFECAKPLKAIITNPSASNPNACDVNVCGTVSFSIPSPVNGYSQVDYNITGLAPGLHGLHVHMDAVGTGGNQSCASAGGHWNPQAYNHGGNLDDQRHVGDLGNILVDSKGVAVGTLLAKVPLVGNLGIKGRAVVVHAGTDDLGLGGNSSSRAVGNAGGRPGCGNIVAV